MSSKISMIGFISAERFFWRRSIDGFWCCIDPTWGPQHVDQWLVDQYLVNATDIFYPGDTLEFKL